MVSQAIGIHGTRHVFYDVYGHCSNECDGIDFLTR